ncbi:MAG TPA: lysophospholipid acyltransferase family protein [Chitinophagales bacterium]|nr:lysophospholipid acyltransferase family protein [Chitinophagales bacterium]
MGRNKSEDGSSGKAERCGCIIDFNPPPENFVWKFTQPLRDYFTPEFLRFDIIEPDKPALYIANHTIYGITDWTLFIAEVYHRKNIFIRTLSDNMHYTIPVWRELVEYFGMIRGTRDNCSALMKAGQHILVYPGGGREVFRLKNEKYSLQWKKRTGFAYMAIQHGYDIIPVAQVGGDDAYEIVADAHDIMHSAFGKFLLNTGIYKKLKDAEYLPPLSKGLLGTALPKPVKLYFSVCERISTKKYKGDTREDNLWRLREETEYELSRELLKLLEYRKKDDIGWMRKLLVKL